MNGTRKTLAPPHDRAAQTTAPRSATHTGSYAASLTQLFSTFTAPITDEARAFLTARLSVAAAKALGLRASPPDIADEFLRCLAVYAPLILEKRLRGVARSSPRRRPLAAKRRGAARTHAGEDRRDAHRGRHRAAQPRGRRPRGHRARAHCGQAEARRRRAPARHGAARTGDHSRARRLAQQRLRGELAEPCGRIFNELKSMLRAARSARFRDPTVPDVTSWLVTRKPAAPSPS